MRLVEHTSNHLINKSCRDGDEKEVGSRLTPFVAIVLGQSSQQTCIYLLGDAWWKRLAASQLLLNSRRYLAGRLQIVTIVPKDDSYPAYIYRGASVTVIGLAVARMAFFAMTVAFTVAWIGYGYSG